MSHRYLHNVSSILLWIFTLLLFGAVKPALAHGEGRTLQRGHVRVSDCYLTI